MVERVHLHLEHGKVRLRRWRTETAYGPETQTIEYGRLSDERFYSDSTRDPGGAHVYPATDQGEAAALRHTHRRMRESGQRFVPIPARFDEHDQPADGLPWIKCGSEWVLPETDNGG